MTEHRLITTDGTTLFYRAWIPARSARKALLLFHRGHEHSGRFQDLVERLALDDYAVFAWDARGHGRSSGERGYAPSISSLARDADEFARHLSRAHDVDLENTAVISTSVGSVVACAWVHDYAPPIRALVLGNPAFRVKLYVPGALPMLRLKQKLLGNSFVKSYVKARMLTHDPHEQKSYTEDPLIARSISVNLLIDLFDTSKRIVEDAAAIRVPTLLLTSGSDWVVRKHEQRIFFDRLGSSVKEMKEYPGFYHAIFHEKDRDLPIAKTKEFILETFSRPTDRPDTGDPEAFTRKEFEKLRKPLGVLSPRRWSFALQRFGMRTLGRLSEGIRRGWRSGFDSGESLDYVYENRPRGRTWLGALIDRTYLDSLGWRGIRQRKANLQNVLRNLVAELGKGKAPIHLLDIASGPGRYLLGLLKENPSKTAAVLRDWSQEGLDAGRALAMELKVSGALYERGDAFDPQSLAQVSPRPDVTIVSGLYELFPENEKVQASLNGAYQGLSPGGYLVYTNQPWHPQVEMIARVLTNRNGDPWIMRRRTQAEMDELVRRAGFEKVFTRVDDFGIFTVSVAQKRSA